MYSQSLSSKQPSVYSILQINTIISLDLLLHHASISSDVMVRFVISSTDPTSVEHTDYVRGHVNAVISMLITYWEYDLSLFSRNLPSYACKRTDCVSQTVLFVTSEHRRIECMNA